MLCWQSKGDINDIISLNEVIPDAIEPLFYALGGALRGSFLSLSVFQIIAVPYTQNLHSSYVDFSRMEYRGLYLVRPVISRIHFLNQIQW